MSPAERQLLELHQDNSHTLKHWLMMKTKLLCDQAWFVLPSLAYMCQQDMYAQADYVHDHHAY